MAMTMAMSHEPLSFRIFQALCLLVGCVAQVEYGADISYPMLHSTVSTNYDYLPHNTNDPNATVIPDEYVDMPIQPLGNRQAFYEHYMKGCGDLYSPKACQSNEDTRLSMIRRQPQSMRNYTTMGFQKIRAPDAVMKLLADFWQANREKADLEAWRRANIYTNHWEAHSKMLSVEDTKLTGAGPKLKSQIWRAARETIEEWTGQALTECSLYGIRIYPEGAVLAPHVDRLPLVASAIINVDQDVDEPWPLEVIGHDGKASNITMEPGDLVLYESHSIIHGRPFPLKGRYMANVFIHFEPTGPLNGKSEFTGDLPPYVIPGSPEEAHWRNANRHGHKIGGTGGATPAHMDARSGNINHLRQLLLDEEQHKIIDAPDTNGWRPLHEAIRAGHVDIVTLLLESGLVDPHARAGKTGGYSPIHLAQQFLLPDQPEVAKTIQELLLAHQKKASASDEL